MAVKVKELPMSERPYEKLEMYGEGALSNAELLAIIIKSGTKEESSVTLAQKILSLGNEKNCEHEDLTFLQDLSIDELTKIKGIGKIKAIQIKSVIELAKRISKPLNIAKVKVKSPQDVARVVMDELKLEKREIVKVVILNSRNIIVKIQTISLGGINSAHVEPKDIFVEAIKIQAPKIILIHNHPSGNSVPSKADCDFTQKVERISEILGIQFLDHLIIGNNEYTSIKLYMLKQRK